MMSGGIASGRAEKGNWRETFSQLHPILKSLPGRIAWAIGGSAALEVQIKHRPASDLDICFRSVEALELLSPATNPKMREIVTEWREHGHFTRLKTESGAVDLVLVRNITGFEQGAATFNNTIVALESPAEVIARKVAHRGGHIQPKDVYDLAVVGGMSAKVGEGLKKIDETRLIAAAGAIAEMGRSWGSSAAYRLSPKGDMMPDVSVKALKLIGNALAAQEAAKDGSAAGARSSQGFERD